MESTRVARVLREDIVLGRREPGSRLVERDIATALNVYEDPEENSISHRLLFDAIAARDVERVARLLQAHLEAGYQAAIERFEVEEEASDA